MYQIAVSVIHDLERDQIHDLDSCVTSIRVYDNAVQAATLVLTRYVTMGYTEAGYVPTSDLTPWAMYAYDSDRERTVYVEVQVQPGIDTHGAKPDDIALEVMTSFAPTRRVTRDN